MIVNQGTIGLSPIKNENLKNKIAQKINPNEYRVGFRKNWLSIYHQINSGDHSQQILHQQLEARESLIILLASIGFLPIDILVKTFNGKTLRSAQIAYALNLGLNHSIQFSENKHFWLLRNKKLLSLILSLAVSSGLHLSFSNKNLKKRVLIKKTKQRLMVSINKRSLDKFLGNSFAHLVKRFRIRTQYLPFEKHTLSNSKTMLVNRSFFSAQMIADYIACQLSLPAKAKDLHFRSSFKKGISKTLNSFFKLEESKNVLGLKFICRGRWFRSPSGRAQQLSFSIGNFQKQKIASSLDFGQRTFTSRYGASNLRIWVLYSGFRLV